MITVFHKSITFASPRNLRTCRQNRLGILRPQFSFFGAVPDAVVLGRLVTELLSTRRYYLVAVLYCESRAKVSKGQLFETRTKNEGENKDKERGERNFRRYARKNQNRRWWSWYREGYIVVASCESVLAAHATALVGDAVPI